MQCEMKDSKKNSKDVRRLETNEGVKNTQQLCAKNDDLVNFNGRTGKEGGDIECSYVIMKILNRLKEID